VACARGIVRLAAKRFDSRRELGTPLPPTVTRLKRT